MRSVTSWPESFHGLPEWWHQAVLSQLQPGLLPTPRDRAGCHPRGSKLTILPHLHTFAHVKWPSPKQPFLKARSTQSKGSEARPQPAQAGPPGGAAVSFTWIWKPRAAGGGGCRAPGAGPGAELICTPLRLGKGLAWGQHNRYLICSSPSGSDGYWDMVMGVV